EAGTGTGKTFAYLVPALLAGGRVIVSTGTKTLQDQLFHRDLPRVRQALGVPIDVALLKGRANYVCLHHLEAAAAQGTFSARDEGASDLLPAANTVIFDEAHHLPDLARLFFGQSLSTSQVLELARDVRLAEAQHAREGTALGDGALELERAARELRLSLGGAA